MIDHRHALTLAATAADFPLDAADRDILEAHVRECAACRVELAAYRHDATRLAALPPIAPPAWVRGVIGRAQRPHRFVLLAAAALLLTASAGTALVVGSALRDSRIPDVPPPVRPVPSPVAVSQPPDHSPAPARTPMSSPPVVTTGSIPVALGGPQVAPGPDGGLYVLIDAPRDLSLEPSGRAVLALLDGAGQPRSGWPIQLTGWSCGDRNAAYRAIFAAPDGSIRLVCSEDVDGQKTPRRAAFAFDATGRAMPGWPVELPSGDISWPPQIVGDELRVVAHEFAATNGNGSPQPGAWWVITVAADGSVRQGARYEVPDISPNVGARLGSDGAAYLLATGGKPNAPTTKIVALDVGGVRAGWPLTVDGVVSYPSVGPQGRLYFTRTQGQGTSTHSQTLVFDPAGRSLAIDSDGLPMAAEPEWTGAGAWLAEPTVAADGTAFVVGELDGRTMVYAIGATGLPMPGWPYRLDAPSQGQGTCSFQDRACGVWRPFVGLDDTVYLLVAAADEKEGGSIVAIGVDGRVRAGWPVRLPAAGARFLSAVVSSDGTVYALAFEPAAGGASWTVYAIAADGSVRARTPIVEP